MLKKHILFLVFLASVAFYAGCSSSDDNNPDDIISSSSSREDTGEESSSSVKSSSSSSIDSEISSSSGEDTGEESSSSIKSDSSSSIDSEISSSSADVQGNSSSSKPVSVSSSSSVVIGNASCEEVKELFCGGANITNSTGSIPDAGACVFIKDFAQIEGDLAGEGSNIKINGVDFPCTDTGKGEEDWAACKVSAAKGNKPESVHGGYYVYVESGNINTFSGDYTPSNGWGNIETGLSTCAPPPPSSSSIAADENFHIYLAFGQSNMEGTSNSAIPNNYKTVDERFQVMAAVTGTYGGIHRTKGQWYTAIPPLVRPSTYLSPADYFGRTIVANTPSNIKVGVIVVAVGGAAIDGFMKTGAPSYYSGEANYMKDWASNYGNDPYKHLIDLAKEAQKVGIIKGIIMHQGESGAKSGNWAQKVNTIYNDMLKDLGLPANSIPFIAGEPKNVNKALVTNLPNTFTATMPNGEKVCHIAKSDGLEIFDQYHFTYESYETLGERYGNIMLELLYK